MLGSLPPAQGCSTLDFDGRPGRAVTWAAGGEVSMGYRQTDLQHLFAGYWALVISDLEESIGHCREIPLRALDYCQDIKPATPITTIESSQQLQPRVHNQHESRQKGPRVSMAARDMDSTTHAGDGPLGSIRWASGGLPSPSTAELSLASSPSQMEGLPFWWASFWCPSRDDPGSRLSLKKPFLAAS